MKSAVTKAIDDLGYMTEEAEIAFFGGSFTAIDRGYMLSLLDAAKPYIKFFKGIRISTRPDCIDNGILMLLKNYNVSTIELGAQSMDDDVLKANRRGHTSDDVKIASELIKKFGFNLGLQMMTGLYKSDFNKDLATADEFIRLKPDCVRVYPTVIMRNTELEELYNSGKFSPYTLSESVDLCSKIMMRFYDNNIDVIRVGLHYSDSLTENDVVKNYHPAFKELCESKIFLDKILNNTTKNNFNLYVNPKSLSKAIGQGRCNAKELLKRGCNVKFKTDNKLSKYEIRID